MFEGKTILIIGGTGTLGRALTDELVESGVRSLRIYARNEHKMFEMRQKYGEPTGKMRYFIGDIRDKDRLDMAMEGADVCINCAALKHVSLSGENPFEAVKTNIVGVQNALECAVKHNIGVFVQISTDKAVNAVNLYGCTKATAEYLVLNAPQWQGTNRTKFIVVRMGNILESSGSVLEVWRKQYAEGKPLTVTDLNAERYAASSKDISKAILRIASNAESGLHVLKMPKYKISDWLKEFGSHPIQITGLREGEKFCEELFRPGEKCTFIELGKK